MRGCEDSALRAFCLFVVICAITPHWVHLKALARTWGHAYANLAIYSRDNAIRIYDANLIVNSRLPGSAWFSLWQNHTNFSWCSCTLLQNTSKPRISGFALARCAQFVCVKAARHHLDTDEFDWSIKGRSVIVLGWCVCLCVCVYVGGGGGCSLWIQLQWTMLDRQLCVVCICAFLLTSRPSQGRDGEPSTPGCLCSASGFALWRGETCCLSASRSRSAVTSLQRPHKRPGPQAATCEPCQRAATGTDRKRLTSR